MQYMQRSALTQDNEAWNQGTEDTIIDRGIVMCPQGAQSKLPSILLLLTHLRLVIGLVLMLGG